jgi:hypothetical protein
MQMSTAVRTSLLVIGLSSVLACATTPDQLPASTAGAGETAYGTSAATAVEVCEPTGERMYLRRLRCPDGAAPAFDRSGSAGSRTTPSSEKDQETALEQMFRDGPLKPGESDYHVIDIYEVRCGSRTTEIIMDMYHCSQSEPSEAPPGFTIVPPQ